ncbi:MAG: rRNA pseudouridine synthase [Lachnospiraceae bacterium]|nr:rRNA pseudouridine synthase [Lachnospiraceae bacterium]
MLRLDRILSVYTAYSRREGSERIKKGRIRVNGSVCLDPSARFEPEGLRLDCDGSERILHENNTFLLNKPAGFVSATEDPKEKTVLDLIRQEDRFPALFPAGRLDKDTTGLLLLTSDGALCHRIISPSARIYKLYRAEVNGPLTEEDALAFAAGLELDGGEICRPAELEILKSGEKSEALVRICEGKYHQIKRMFAARGLMVLQLKREAVGGLTLPPDLKEGDYIRLDEAALRQLFSTK